jgi:hypothetical protein
VAQAGALCDQQKEGEWERCSVYISDGQVEERLHFN